MAALMPDTTVPEMLAADTELRTNIEDAAQALRDAGCPAHAVPFGPDGVVRPKRARDMTKHVQKKRAEEPKTTLGPQEAAYLASLAEPQASQWILEACPSGRAQPDAT